MLGARCGSGKAKPAARAAGQARAGAIIRGAHDGHVRIVNIVVNTAIAGATAAPHSFKDVWLISAGHAFTHWYTATFYLLLPLI